MILFKGEGGGGVTWNGGIRDFAILKGGIRDLAKIWGGNRDLRPLAGAGLSRFSWRETGFLATGGKRDFLPLAGNGISCHWRETGFLATGGKRDFLPLAGSGFRLFCNFLEEFKILSLPSFHLTL